jgi:hypothetical protein
MYKTDACTRESKSVNKSKQEIIGRKWFMQTQANSIASYNNNNIFSRINGVYINLCIPSMNWSLNGLHTYSLFVNENPPNSPWLI